MKIPQLDISQRLLVSGWRKRITSSALFLAMDIFVYWLECKRSHEVDGGRVRSAGESLDENTSLEWLLRKLKIA